MSLLKFNCCALCFATVTRYLKQMEETLHIDSATYFFLKRVWQAYAESRR